MKDRISTSDAPSAIGPYSQAIRIDGFIFTSGQLGLLPESMQMVEGGITEQTRQALENLKAVLMAAGSSLAAVCKTTCFLADIDDFAAFNEVYKEYFGTADAPARSCVQAARIPRNGLVEVEAIAVAI